MTELTFISNKARKEVNKYLFVIALAVIIWVLQVSVISYFFVFDTTPSLFLLGSIYCGLSYGLLPGTIFGAVCSFFIASTLYDHTFYFSYPLTGLFSGLLIKNFFSYELLFYTLLSFVFTFIVELLNGMQYGLNSHLNIVKYVLDISIPGSVLNLILAVPFYFFMRLITKRLNLW